MEYFNLFYYASAPGFLKLLSCMHVCRNDYNSLAPEIFQIILAKCPTTYTLPRKVGVLRGGEAFTRRLVHGVMYVNNFSLSYVCNMGRSNLPDMYARALRCPSADISGKSRLHMLHMLFNTSGTIKIAQTYKISIYINAGVMYNYGICI